MQTVIKVIAQHLDVAESKVTPEAHLVDDLGSDPFDTIELCIQVEKATGVKYQRTMVTESRQYKI